MDCIDEDLFCVLCVNSSSVDTSEMEVKLIWNVFAVGRREEDDTVLGLWTVSFQHTGIAFSEDKIMFISSYILKCFSFSVVNLESLGWGSVFSVCVLSCCVWPALWSSWPAVNEVQCLLKHCWHTCLSKVFWLDTENHIKWFGVRISGSGFVQPSKGPKQRWTSASPRFGYLWVWVASLWKYPKTELLPPFWATCSHTSLPFLDKLFSSLANFSSPNDYKFLTLFPHCIISCY